MHRAAALRPSALSAVSRRQCAASLRPSRWVRHASRNSQQEPAPASSRSWSLGLIPVLAVSAGAGWYLYPSSTGGKDETGVPDQPPAGAGPEPKKKAKPQEENRDLLNSQHLQVVQSWENPGVYAWGSNAGRVVAPESSEAVVKTPRRIPFFDGMILRDLKLDRNFGVAVTEEGDIVQWGTAFAPDTTTPVKTLKGKDIEKVAISSDRVLALSRAGAVYSLPVARSDQQPGSAPAQKSSSWIPFWSGSSDSAISYRVLTPAGLARGEKVVDISSGLEHALLLTSGGRVFAAASSTENFPSKGQLGVPGLTWLTKPEGPFDQPHEVKGLPTAGISQIATGNYHSLALGNDSRVLAWGDNSTGQLGFEVDPKSPAVDAPTAVPLENLYRGSAAAAAAVRPLVRSIAAGGSNSYFTVDAAAGSGKETSDTWACGEGLYGALGTGRWTHMTTAPTKVRALSGLSEYDDQARRTVPIRVRRLSVGSTHAAAVMDNLTCVNGGSGPTTTATEGAANWGSDVVWWGGNEFYQLGTGRRSNLNEPTRIAPLGGTVGRLQLTPPATVRIGEGGKGRRVSLEQKIECGRYVTAVYSATS